MASLRSWVVRFQSAEDPIALDADLVVAGDNAGVLAKLPDGAFDLIYMDPPFNTGRAQARRSLSMVADPVGGDRIGFDRESCLSAVGYLHNNINGYGQQLARSAGYG